MPDYASDDASSWRGLPRWAGLFGGTAILLAFIVWASGPMVVEVLLGLLIDGLYLTLWLLAAYGVGRHIVSALVIGCSCDACVASRQSREPQLATQASQLQGLASTGATCCTGGQKTRLLRRVTAISIGLGVMGLLIHGLGLLGLNVTLYLLLGLAILGNACSLLRLKERELLLTPWLRTPSISATAFLVLSIPLAIALAGASIAPGFLWKPLDPHPYDAMAYHLQVPRDWFEAGRISPLTHNVFGYFPMLMESHYLAAMQLRSGPWAGMYLCQLMTLAHGALAVIAVAGAARALGAKSLAAWAGAILAAGVPWTMMLSSVAYVETGVMLYTVLAVGWAAVALRSDTPWRAMALAGLATGLACGMKYTAFVMTGAVGLGVFALFLMLRRPPAFPKPVGATPASSVEGRSTLADEAGLAPTEITRSSPEPIRRKSVIALSCFILLAALTASPWLIRNAIWTGNPVFPLATSVFGQGHFTPEQVERYEAAHRPPDAEAGIASRLSSGVNRSLLDPQFGYILLPAALLAAALRWRSKPAMLILAMILGAGVVWVAATHVMPRFLAPVIPLAAVLIALAADRPAWAKGVVVLAVLQLAVGVTWTLRQMSPNFTPERQGLLRLPDYRPLEEPLIAAAVDRGRPVALIGEAQAFFYRTPLAEKPSLLYRSVFDVTAPADQPAADQWLGRSVEELRAAGYTVVVNAAELERLGGTYRHLSKQVTPTPSGVIVLPPK